MTTLTNPGRTFYAHGLRMLFLAVIVIVASTAVALGSAAPAQALCVTPTEQGDWHNIDANTNSITRAVVTFNCSDQVLCDTDGHCTGGDSTFAVNLYGKCQPTDCDWGTVNASDQGDGWLLATYDFGFKTSYVWLKTYPYYGLNYLRVYTDNRFAPGDGRANYTTDEWFLQ